MRCRGANPSRYKMELTKFTPPVRVSREWNYELRDPRVRQTRDRERHKNIERERKRELFCLNGAASFPGSPGVRSPGEDT